MDRATEQIRTQIQVVERNLKVLEETIVKMIRLREDTQQFMQEFATSMNNIGAEEYDTNVAHCIQSLGTSFSNVSKKTTDLMLHRPQSHILQVLTHIQDWGIVPIQVQIRSLRYAIILISMIAAFRRSRENREDRTSSAT